MTFSRYIQNLCHVQAHATKNLICLQAAAHSKENQVSCLSRHFCTQCLKFFWREELGDRTSYGTVLFEGNPCKSLGAKTSSYLGKLIYLRAWPRACTLNIDCLNVLAFCCRRRAKELKAGLLEDLRDIVELHTNAGIRLIGAVGIHCVPVLNLAQWSWELNAHLCKCIAQNILKLGHDIFLADKCHLHINLCKLRLTICTKILIAEALSNLVVALNTANHQQLLQQLWRLWQCIEVSALHSGWNQEVTSSLRSRFEQRRSLYLGKITLMECLAKRKGKIRTHTKILCHLRTTQVNVAVPQAKVLVHVNVVLNLEWWDCTGVKNLNL